MPRVAIVDHGGTSTGIGAFLRSLVRALLELPGSESWAFDVLLPEIDYGGDRVRWPADLACPRLSVRMTGDATGRLDGSEWIEAVLSTSDWDVAYFVYPYLASSIDTALPIVATFHDFNYLRFDSLSPEMRSHMRREVPKWLRRCDVAVVSSRFIASELISYYPGLPRRLEIVRLGVPTVAGESPGEEEAEAVRKALGLPSRFFVTVGWLAPHKNQAVALSALANLKSKGVEIALALVGPNANQMRNGLHPAHGYTYHLGVLAADLGLAIDRDYFPLGHLSRREVEGLYRSAMTLVMPTLYEAGSFPVREALRLGCPVVCSDIPAIEEDLEVLGVRGHLFDPHSASELTDALLRIIEEPEPARRDAVKASEVVEAAFDWQTTARGYVRAFEAAIESRSRHPA